MAGNPVTGGAQLIARQSSGRKAALAIVLAIAGAEVLLSGRAKAVWTALWGPSQPLSRGGTSGTSGTPTSPVGTAQPSGSNNNSGSESVGAGTL